VGRPGSLRPVVTRRPRSAIALRAVSGSRSSTRCPWRALAFPAAVLAVHQLCYLLAYGSGASAQLSAHGDGYVGVAAIVAVALGALALALGVLRLVAAWRGDSQPRLTAPPVWLLWLGTTLALLAGFCALEGLEIALEPHHVGGVVGIFGQGGWWALPTAAFVGAVMTLLVRGGRALLVIVARGRPTPRLRTTASRCPRASWSAPLRRPMAGCVAGRAPPARRLAWQPAPARRRPAGQPNERSVGRRALPARGR